MKAGNAVRNLTYVEIFGGSEIPLQDKLYSVQIKDGKWSVPMFFVEEEDLAKYGGTKHNHVRVTINPEWLEANKDIIPESLYSQLIGAEVWVNKNIFAYYHVEEDSGQETEDGGQEQPGTGKNNKLLLLGGAILAVLLLKK